MNVKGGVERDMCQQEERRFMASIVLPVSYPMLCNIPTETECAMIDSTSNVVDRLN